MNINDLEWVTDSDAALVDKATSDPLQLSPNEHAQVVQIALRAFGELQHKFFTLALYGQRMADDEMVAMKQAFDLIDTLTILTPAQISDASIAAYWEHRA